MKQACVCTGVETRVYADVRLPRCTTASRAGWTRPGWREAVRSHRVIAGILCLFFRAGDGIRDLTVTGVQTCALPISLSPPPASPPAADKDGYGYEFEDD